MLEYSKEILRKLNFDKGLREKEYTKLIKLLTPNEVENLNVWFKKELGYYPHQLTTKK